MQHLNSNAVNIAIETCMELLRSLGNVSATLTRCRDYFESLKTWAVDKNRPAWNAGPASNVHMPPFSQSARAPTVHPAYEAESNQPTGTGGGPSNPRTMDHMDELFSLNMEQIMTDYPGDLFSDPSLGDLSFWRMDTV